MTWYTELAVDHDRWACDTYRANFPGANVQCVDLRESMHLIREGMASVVIGGPPCTPHSHAGKRQASADIRDCGPDFSAAVAKAQPRMFLMENVDGLLTSENWRYWQRLYKSFEDAGYVVEFRVLDAVNFGVPQFRRRLWAWGIRRDLYVDGIRHRWPKPTHAWPPPGPCMFGAALLPGVTVRQALGLDGWLRAERGQGMCERHGPRRDVSCDEPSPSLGAGSAGSGPRYLVIERIRGKGMNERHGARRDHPIDEPCPTIGVNHGGGGPPLYLKSHADPLVSVDRPAPTVRSGGNGHDGCRFYLYDAQNDTARSCDRPAGTIQGNAQAKGGKAGHYLAVIDAPSHTLSGSSREPIQNWKNKGYRRRLTPDECLRLQSAPDQFVWADGIKKTARYRVVGNGWASTMGAVFAAAFAAADPDSHTVIDLFCGGGLGAVGWHDRHWSYQPKSEVASA